MNPIILGCQMKDTFMIQQSHIANHKKCGQMATELSQHCHDQEQHFLQHFIVSDSSATTFKVQYLSLTFLNEL
jgi:hypothetical protein